MCPAAAPAGFPPIKKEFTMKKTFVAVTGIMLTLMMLFVSCDGSSSGVPSSNEIRTKSDLLASMPGVVIPPSNGLKNPDESTIALVKSVLNRLNSDYNGEAINEETGSTETNLVIYDDESTNGYILQGIRDLSETEFEQTINGRVTADGKEVVFNNFKMKMNNATEDYSESGSVTVNGKSVDFEYAMDLIPKDEKSMKEYWSLDVNNYRSGTYSVFSGREIQDNEYNYSDGIVVLDITADGHKVQLKYTCSSDASSFRYNSACKLDYVAVDGTFFDVAKF